MQKEFTNHLLALFNEAYMPSACIGLVSVEIEKDKIKVVPANGIIFHGEREYILPLEWFDIPFVDAVEKLKQLIKEESEKDKAERMELLKLQDEDNERKSWEAF